MSFMFEVSHFSLLTLPKSHFSLLSVFFFFLRKKFGYFDSVTLSKNHFDHLTTHLVQ